MFYEKALEVCRGHFVLILVGPLISNPIKKISSIFDVHDNSKFDSQLESFFKLLSFMRVQDWIPEVKLASNLQVRNTVDFIKVSRHDIDYGSLKLIMNW